jgi:hypothetical protein
MLQGAVTTGRMRDEGPCETLRPRQTLTTGGRVTEDAIARRGFPSREGGSREAPLKRLSRWPLVLLTLLFGNPAAVVAADDNMPKSGASGPTATASQPTPKDTLSLSDSERSIVQQDISQYATKAKAPPGFAEVGAVVPN